MLHELCYCRVARMLMIMHIIKCSAHSGLTFPFDHDFKLSHIIVDKNERLPSGVDLLSDIRINTAYNPGADLQRTVVTVLVLGMHSSRVSQRKIDNISRIASEQCGLH